MSDKNPASVKAPSGNPWGWIPSVYIAEGLPYFAVNVLTVIMYTNLGIPKAQMTFYTGLLYLPWVIKPFWSPFIDIIRTKRWWTLLMQLAICVSMGLAALFISTSSFFTSTLIVFWLMAFFSATHDIAADGFYMMALDEEKQAAYVGVRSTFYRIASVLGQGGVVILAGWLETKYNDIPLAWSITFTSLSLFFLLIFLWDLFMMPSPEKDRPLPGIKAGHILKEFCNTFITFFKKKHIGIALLFILLYRLPEALCLKLVQPFLLDSTANGGLGLTTAEVGMANGTVGVLCLLAGGILGGIYIARRGLKKSLWPMALALTIPCFVYCLFAFYLPQSIVLISCGLGFEQFGYGFGFTAYMVYLMYFSAGESQTSHYAFCTAFMALGMMIPGMFAGWIFNVCEKFGNFIVMSQAGYVIFFFFIMSTCILTFYAVFKVLPTLKK